MFVYASEVVWKIVKLINPIRMFKYLYYVDTYTTLNFLFYKNVE